MTKPTRSRSRRGRRTDAEAARTREAILGAAEKAFAERGFEGASLRAIAQDAGTTHGLIRHHFGSKAQVWEAVVDRAIARYVEPFNALAARAAREGPEAPRSLIEELVRRFVNISGRHPAFLRLALNEGAAEGPRLAYLHRRVRPFHRAFASLFDQVHARGHLQGFNRDNWFLALLMIGGAPFAVAPLSARLTGGKLLDPDAIDAHADRVVLMLFGPPENR